MRAGRGLVSSSDESRRSSGSAECSKVTSFHSRVLPAKKGSSAPIWSRENSGDWTIASGKYWVSHPSIGSGQNVDRRIEVRGGIKIYGRLFKPHRHLQMAPRLVRRWLSAGAHRQEGAGCDFVQGFGNEHVVNVDAANRLSAFVLQRRERSPSVHDQFFFGANEGTKHAPNRGGNRPVQQKPTWLRCRACAQIFAQRLTTEVKLFNAGIAIANSHRDVSIHFAATAVRGVG